MYSFKFSTQDSIMNTSEESLSGQESLRIIQQMINRAKPEMSRQSFYPLLWGWIVLVASLAHFLLIRYSAFKYPAVVWSLIIFGIIGTVAKARQQRRKRGSRTFTSSIIGLIWVTFLVNYFILLGFMPKLYLYFIPVILLMEAGSLILTSFVLKHKAYFAGGILVWIAAIISFMIPVEWQLLAVSCAALFGFMMPGYILKNRQD
jgi:hypothetical protein